MSSLSSSAIHLGGEFVMGCEDKTNIFEQDLGKLYNLVL